MKLSRLAFAAAVAWGIHAGNADAQVRQPVAAQPVNFESYYYQSNQPSPSDQGAAMKQAPIQAKAAGACAEEAAEEEEACEPWRLFCQKECGWNVYGWANGGVMANFHNPPDHFNGPVTFADRDYGQFNQLYGVIEKTVDTGGCGWDWGGRMDVLFGSDYVFTMATGLELTDDAAPKWNQKVFPGTISNPEYGLALPQIYGEVAYNDLSVKVGHFYTVLGYEVVPATGNFFYTHAYTMQYGEPFTHTGALATYKYSETTKLVGGVVNGWDHFDRVVDTGAGIGGIAWDGGEGLTVAYNVIFSPNEPVFFGPNAGALTNRNCASLVIGYTFGCDDEWQYVFQNDVGWQHNANAFPGVAPGVATSAEWYGINQYLFYTINDCWKAGLRAEWFRDDDGARVTGLRNPNNSIFGDNFVGNFYEISVGMNWTPSANLTVRPEIRYDSIDQELPPSVAGTRPYAGQDRVDQWLAGFDVIYLW
jgi:hypothetical protein